MLSDPITPQTIGQALTLPEKSQWQDAINSELKSIHDNQVWELVPRNNQKVIGTRWLFKIKKDDNNIPVRFKARLVAKGYSQIYGIDYNETFAPVVKLQSLRAIMAIAANKKLLVHQIDIDTAFLNGELTEEVFTEPRHGTNVSNEFVCKLKKTYEIMEMYSINNEKPVDTPIQPNLGLSIDLVNEEDTMRVPVDTTKYRQAIGKLMYLMICSRPDLSFSVSLLLRFLHSPKEKHWRCILRLLRYIKSTRDYSVLVT